MKSYRALLLLAPTILLLFCSVQAQGNEDQVTQIHKNVKLIKREPPNAIPEELKTEYLRFLPLFEEVLTENTVDQSADCELTIRVEPGVKKVGSKGTPRATARVTGFRKNSKREYVSTLILYSYARGAAVNKDEITKFLKRRILDPAKCQPAAAPKAAGTTQ